MIEDRPSAAQSERYGQSILSYRACDPGDHRQSGQRERARPPVAPWSPSLRRRSCRSPLEFIPHRQQLDAMLFDPAPRLSQDLAWGITRQQLAVRDAQLCSKVRSFDMDMRRVLILEEHQELVAAKAPALGHVILCAFNQYRAFFALVQV